MTETWYWGFYESESNLHGFIHIWTHPNLKLCTAGIFAHFGHKQEHLAAEVFDFRNFTPDEIFDDKGNITLANGLKVTFIEPTKKMRIQYENKDRTSAWTWSRQPSSRSSCGRTTSTSSRPCGRSDPWSTRAIPTPSTTFDPRSQLG
jgi:hypothetical protein